MKCSQKHLESITSQMASFWTVHKSSLERELHFQGAQLWYKRTAHSIGECQEQVPLLLHKFFTVFVLKDPVQRHCRVVDMVEYMKFF
jgi:hypothetical protein